MLQQWKIMRWLQKMDGQFILEGDCVVRKQQFLERKCVKGCKNPLQGGFMREIRRCGKSYLLNNIFFHHLLDNGVRCKAEKAKSLFSAFVSYVITI